ncbi:CinA family protein [Actinomyces mediterranea]|uniref:CinA family protein n=1 Tax=Actinomyces mediterranea TaxID=1871028 RepID=UPI00097106AE|nr:CinA family protein [Actinomyces mediterranea]
MNSDDLHRLINDLSQARLSIATAESVTGGALCARLVDVPGASAVVRGGVCTYATDLKASVLGVDADLLAARGPVDAEVALQMARGVRALMGADIGVSTTGVAGPGPADGHEVGTVHIAVNGPGGEDHRELHLVGERAQIRALSVDAALHLVRSVLDSGDQGAGD